MLMPDREKVEEWARDFMAYVDELDIARDAYRGIMEYIEDALAMLKEQEAVEPRECLYPRGTYACGFCDYVPIGNKDGYRANYCPECGRRVKW